MAKKNMESASVLAYEKKLVFSDGYMYAASWEDAPWENDKAGCVPLHLVEKSVRGTISNRQRQTAPNDPAKLNAEIEKPNLQLVDACALDMAHDTLKLAFSLKVLSGVERPSACNNAIFAQKYEAAAKAYIEKTGFRELARRYAANIANARFLWRNRLGAEQIKVKVMAEAKEWLFDAYDFSLRDFGHDDEQINELGEIIAEALSGRKQFAFLRVEAYALAGRGQEVYPSEELVFNKDKGNGEKSKVLYAANGIAAMHSQKIGNAIRTIDTWYPEFDNAHIGPIAIEPFGAVTTLGKAFRNPKEKADFYTLFDKYVLGEPLDNMEQEHYVMAVLVRGGVFGQSSKE